MKMAILSLSILANILGCRSGEARNDLSLIPGKYVRYSDVGVRKSYDTLVISTLNESEIQIQQFSTYQKILDGQPLPWQHTRQSWVARFDEASKSYVEKLLGKTVSLDENGDGILIGENKFKRIAK
jgi:hypothetical protein